MTSPKQYIRRQLKTRVRHAIHGMGYDVEKRIPADLPNHHAGIIATVREFTMTSEKRLSSLITATDYVSAAGIEGAVVECGVWRGGSCMAAMSRLRDLGDTEREVFLFDTYEGMSEPTEHDISHFGDVAVESFDDWKENAEEEQIMCYASLEDVQNNVSRVGYPKDRIHYVKGMVEDTLPQEAPEKIALLRLDTDWYESTRHELETLYPRLEPGGVLIIDDYGFWQGARKAVDEYLAENEIHLLLNRVDGTGRLAVKPH